MLVSKFAFVVAAAVAVILSARAEPISVPGPEGPLAGELIDVPGAREAVLIIPGSGPTDRDGNGPATGLRTDAYKLLAEGLADAGIASLRIDKRGFFGSERAVADPENVTIAAYADDVRRWSDALQARTHVDCVWLAGHSEGGLVALAAVERGAEPCGVVLLAAPGRPIGKLMREQFRRNPANLAFLDELDGLVTALEAGEMRDPRNISPPLRPLFRLGLQRYMIQLFRYDPAAMAREVTKPVLIVQGDRDVQVTVDDAQLLAQAMPHAMLAVVPGVTHMLKQALAARPFATYLDPELEIDRVVLEYVVSFVLRGSG